MKVRKYYFYLYIKVYIIKSSETIIIVCVRITRAGVSFLFLNKIML